MKMMLNLVHKCDISKMLRFSYPQKGLMVSTTFSGLSMRIIHFPLKCKPLTGGVSFINRISEHIKRASKQYEKCAKKMCKKMCKKCAKKMCAKKCAKKCAIML
jgi:hypothetical protein